MLAVALSRQPYLLHPPLTLLPAVSPLTLLPAVSPSLKVLSCFSLNPRHIALEVSNCQTRLQHLLLLQKHLCDGVMMMMMMMMCVCVCVCVCPLSSFQLLPVCKN